MKLRKTGLIILGILMILIIGFKVYLEIDNVSYNNRIENMNNNNELTGEVTCSVEHKTLTMDGYDIHYYVSGKAHEHLIVFLHPAFSDHTAFDQQIDYFSKKYCVITVDLIGHGLSKAHKSKDQIDASLQHLEKILETEGYDKAHVVGVSMGSLVAQYFTHKHPGKTKTLIALGGYNINKDNKDVKKSQQSVNLGLIVRAVFSMKSFRKKVAEMSCKTEQGQILCYKTLRHYDRRSFKVMQGLQNIVKHRENIKPQFPVLILTGAYDIDLAKTMGESWHSETEGSQYKQIKDAGHCANIDNPSEFNQVVSVFIDANND
ncbi:MAG: hypothetical protein CR968_04355 [Flavobacteriia bacterium]|nr:MAG: hypothetical protein CR968_04355 [Flavobacteriia bacterium]